MTSSEPDYTAQHRVIALQCSVALSHMGLFTSLNEVLDQAETLLTYLNDGTLPTQTVSFKKG